jgi:outer membrane lipoprotein-sorting protein
MSIFERHPRLRWAVPAAAVAVIVAGSLVGPVAASADSGLPARTAEQLLVDLQSPQATALSGTVVITADLGLPTLPAGMGSGADPTAMLTGSHTVRVWQDGPDRTRLALIDTAEETDLIRNGSEVWVWSSAEKTAEHMVLPERDGAKPQDAVDGMPKTPQEAAALVLQGLDESTAVTTSGVGQVAGRPAYELILTPRQADTLVARVVVAMDAEMRIPLRLQVFSTQGQDPAYEVGFTSVDFSTPDASLFTFTPPPGTEVTEHDAPGATTDRSGASTRDAQEPTVVGTGWSRVMVTDVPPDALTGLMSGDTSSSGGLDAATVLGALPRISGEWGSGTVLAGTLFSAILTDDGRVAFGAVSPETLGAALAAS